MFYEKFASREYSVDDWLAVRTFAFLVGGMATAVCVVCYEVYDLGRLGNTASFRMDHALSAPTAGFLIGLIVAAYALIKSAFVYIIVLLVLRALLGLRESNIRSWPASFVAGVFTAVGDRVLNGPFEEWVSSYPLFNVTCTGHASFSQSAWRMSYPLDWIWIFGFPALCALFLLRRSRLAELDSSTA